MSTDRVLQPGDRVRVTVRFAPTDPAHHYLGNVKRVLDRPMLPSGRDVDVTLDDPKQWHKDTRCWPEYLGQPIFSRDQIKLLQPSNNDDESLR